MNRNYPPDDIVKFKRFVEEIEKYPFVHSYHTTKTSVRIMIDNDKSRGKDPVNILRDLSNIHGNLVHLTYGHDSDDTDSLYFEPYQFQESIELADLLTRRIDIKFGVELGQDSEEITDNTDTESEFSDDFSSLEKCIPGKLWWYNQDLGLYESPISFDPFNILYPGNIDKTARVIMEIAVRQGGTQCARG